jgi:hypothetical protein
VLQAFLPSEATLAKHCIVTGKMVLKMTSVLASCRRIEARCKDSVKVTVMFITMHYTFNRLKVGCLLNENKGSGFKVGIFTEKLSALGPFSSGMIS